MDVNALRALVAEWRQSAADLAVEPCEHGYDSTEDMVNDEIAATYAEAAERLEKLLPNPSECDCPSRRWQGMGQVHAEGCPNS